jgi:3-isopropylmalate/(R)-2-methylmalate dehydratase small subunit
MALQFKGKVWVFGDNLDVDFEILSFRELDQGIIAPDKMGEWCMRVVDPDFAKKVTKGDIMVVGTNMGCGHDHYLSNVSIKQSGISCVIAESFDRNFFRNSIAVGLPIIEYPGINKLAKQGDELSVDLKTGTIKNITTGKSAKFKPFPDFLLEIVDAGGLELYGNKLIAEGREK